MSGWTDERVEKLTTLWQQGKTASQIAQELGDVTRNAVIGKVHRLGLSGRPSPIKRKQKKKEVVKRVKTNKASGASPKKATVQKLYKEELPKGGGASMMELKERMCKWPIGDPRSSEFKFCGERTEEGLPYCSHHAQVAYQTPSRKREKINEDALASL